MAVILGRDGSLTFDGNVVVEVKSFKITETMGSYDRNVIGQGEWDDSVGGRKSWSAEVEGYYDPDDTTGHGGIQLGAEGVGEFFPEGDTTGKERRHGTCRVEERTVTNSEDGLVEVSLKLKGRGILNDAAVA